jgi:hypothetical protein
LEINVELTPFIAPIAFAPLQLKKLMLI